MKVGHPGTPVSNNNDVKQGGRAATTQDTRGPSGKGSGIQAEKTSGDGATAEISSKSKEFARAKAAALDAPDVRADRVNDLRRKIAEGKYKVDSNAVADRLVDDHLKMSDMG